MRRAGVLLLALVLAGCSGGGKGPGAASAADGFGDLGATASAGKGLLLGVVVDESIRPLPGADVVIALPTGPINRTTDADGRFAFGELDPGTYLVAASLLNYKPAQASIDVAADDPAPAVNRIQLTRLFSQDPYSIPLKFEGYIQCGYSVSGVMSSLCLNDYTHFVPVVGTYTCPECEHILDRRSSNFAIDAGWQTAIFEMTWDPSAQGTSDNMRLTISHFPRSASHWYCGGVGEDPVLVRMELNVTCDDQQSTPEQVPPEGLPNMHMFAATAAAGGAPASMAFSQQFAVFTHLFYYGKPPEGWSFIAGDEPPF